ncbi:MAG TPA: ATP-dependent sacrificial sulfur transferase LarE [Acidobacteria bacterium]|nr:ATP-dependent sacrificial sulfur transferase LarE [Acidobacteriota bacterium]
MRTGGSPQRGKNRPENRTGRRLNQSLVRKYERLKNELKAAGSVLVAFSGGVDSSLLLRVAADVLKDQVLAVTVDTPLFSRQEMRAVQKLAKSLQVNLMIVKANSLELPAVAKNSNQRCYYCKLFLFSGLKQIAKNKGLNQIVEGSNLDDTKDFRPGEKAIKELGIRSPLVEAGFRKKDIRQLAKYLGLPNWNKPEAACLASRIPYGQPLDRKLLSKIERGERALISLGFSQVRLRHHGEIARIEINLEDFSRWLKPEIRTRAVSSLKKLGYRYVVLDLEGYRTGSLNPPAVK